MLIPFLIALLIGLLLLNVIINQRSASHYAALLPLPPTSALPAATVDVIVPARNEADCIAACVGGLLAQQYPACTLTVVDDASTDGTGDIASQVGALVVSLSGTPPTGWTGKCNACDQAARRSRAEWLLFTDADTLHQPDALARAVAYAEAEKLDALSLLLRQECATFAERMVLPLAYQNFFAALNPAQPTFNGQYILIRREVYAQSGGFGAAEVRGRVMEDVALAELLNKRGFCITLLNGESAAAVRMYRTLGGLWQGMTKTTLTAARDRGLAGIPLALPFFFGVWLLPIAAVAAFISAPMVFALVLLNIAVTGIILIPWLRRFGVPQPLLHAALNPVGVSFLATVGLVAILRTALRRGVQWKGRVIR